MQNEIKRILLIIGANVGDAICATPAIAALRQHRPELKLGLLAASVIAADVFRDNSAIDEIYVTPPAKQIKIIAKDYQLALDLLNNFQTKIYHKELPIPCFVSPGPNPLHLREHPFLPMQQAFPDLTISPAPYQLYVRQEDRNRIKDLLLASGATLSDKEILIGCHMGCSKVALRLLKFWRRKIASHRTWPFENYRALYESLRQRHPSIRFVLTGTVGEQRLVKKYFKGAGGIVDLTGKTSLHELAALMEYCHLFLTGDTAPLHIASTTRVPLVALFGSTCPEVTGPYPMRDNIVCIQGETIKDISIEQVQSAIESLLFKTAYVG